MSSPIEILDRLYLLPACKPACNVYLIKGESKNTLIDTGIRENKNYLQVQLDKLNLSFQDIHDVIYTHCHYDHTGGGEFFPTADIYAHDLCKIKLQYQDETCIHALKYNVALPTNIPNKTLVEGDTYHNSKYTFHILHTPGHTDDSICLLDITNKILISSDTVFARGIPALITDSGSDASLLYSMNKLSQYDIDMILPGHGISDNKGNQCITKTIEHILHRIEKTNKKIIKEANLCIQKKY